MHDAIRILLVEDDINVSRTVTRMLHTLGYRVHAVHSADAALATLGRYSYDVIISDHHLGGGMDGVQLLELCRRSFPALRRILTTAATDFNIATRAVNDAAIGSLIRKPATATALGEALSILSAPPADHDEFDQPTLPVRFSMMKKSNTMAGQFGMPTTEAPVMSARGLQGAEAEAILAEIGG
jgi:DNA-binding NtrC family response regulator